MDDERRSETFRSAERLVAENPERWERFLAALRQYGGAAATADLNLLDRAFNEAGFTYQEIALVGAGAY